LSNTWRTFETMKVSYSCVCIAAIASCAVDANLRAINKLKPNRHKEVFTSRIIGGTEAVEGEFPFFGKLVLYGSSVAISINRGGN
jgi:secreted trypsin-like serine protease